MRSLFTNGVSRAIVACDESNDERSLAYRVGGHRPEEPDIGGSGARRPKPGGKAVAPKQGVGGLLMTLDLGATRYRDFQRDVRGGS